MAFFFNRTDAPNHDSWIDLRGRIALYTNNIIDMTMPIPIVEVGNMLIVHLHPEYAHLVAEYETHGFCCGINHVFKVTRLLPWNHPSDKEARDVWTAHMRFQEQDTAIQYFMHDYPPLPKLERSSNEPRLDMFAVVPHPFPYPFPEPLIL
jgi:hypothetical protein